MQEKYVGWPSICAYVHLYTQVKLYGTKGEYFGSYRAESLRHITALGMQYPSTKTQVPEADYVNLDTINALVDFHEGNYRIPECFGTLAHHVMAADALGDDMFLQFVSWTFEIPISRINTSNKSQNIRMALRDRMRLKQIVPQLEISSHI